jgi:hypothetical protein
MKNYKLTDPRPFTYPQLISYCSSFFKKRFVEKLVAQAIEKDASLKEESLMCGKPKTFYLDGILIAMEEIDSNFKSAHEKHKCEVEKQKVEASREPWNKLMNVLFGKSN